MGEGVYRGFPMFHNSGKSAINSCMVRGGRYVFRDKFSATHFWDYVKRTGVVLATLVGPMTALMHAQPARPDDADNPLRAIVLGPMIPKMEAFERRFGVRIGHLLRHDRDRLAVHHDLGPRALADPAAGPGPTTRSPRWPIVDEHDEPVPVVPWASSWCARVSRGR